MKIKIILENEKLKPVYKTMGSGGCDLVANIEETVLIQPNSVKEFGTGIRMHIVNPSYAGIILPRSGKGNEGLIIASTVGLIDSDHQGEMKLTMWNRSNRPIEILPYEAIAQLVIIPVIQASWLIVDEFDEVTERGEGGHGSTGRFNDYDVSQNVFGNFNLDERINDHRKEMDMHKGDRELIYSQHAGPSIKRLLTGAWLTKENVYEEKLKSDRACDAKKINLMELKLNKGNPTQEEMREFFHLRSEFIKNWGVSASVYPCIQESD